VNPKIQNNLTAFAANVLAIAGICACNSTAAAQAAAQKVKVVTSTKPESDSFVGIYLLAFALGVLISGAAFLWFRHRLLSQLAEQESPAVSRSTVREPVSRRKKKKAVKNAAVTTVEETVQLKSQLEDLIKKNHEQYRILPIFEIKEILVPCHVEPLPYSNDEELISAIERSNVEVEGDDNVREAALAILADFRTSNSVDAIAEVALYDLSTGLRSMALAALADFDHEAVFETILLQCRPLERSSRGSGPFVNTSDHRSDRSLGQDLRVRRQDKNSASCPCDRCQRPFESHLYPDNPCRSGYGR